MCLNVINHPIKTHNQMKFLILLLEIVKWLKDTTFAPKDSLFFRQLKISLTSAYKLTDKERLAGLGPKDSTVAWKLNPPFLFGEGISTGSLMAFLFLFCTIVPNYLERRYFVF